MRPKSMMAIGAACGLIAFPSVLEADEPCSKCGPGDHWIDTCPGTTEGNHDFIPTSVVEVGVIFVPVCGEPRPDTTLVFSGGFTVGRGAPLDVSVQFPDCREGTCQDGACVGGSDDGMPCVPDGHLDVIDTQIVEMLLTGANGMTLTAGAGLGHNGMLGPSRGIIWEDPSNPGMGKTRFELFFEIDDGAGVHYYNHEAFVVEADITRVPPLAALEAHNRCIYLYDAPAGVRDAVQNGSIIEPSAAFPSIHLIAPEATEVCCMPNGSCSEVAPGSCLVPPVIGGPCNQCLGVQACCGEVLAAGQFDCYLADATCCLANGHTPQGVGTLCMPEPEACCFRNGACQMLDPLCCLDLGGTPKGAGSDCLGDSDGDGVDDACGGGVPAVSEWGMAALVLLFLTGYAVKFRRARAKHLVDP